MRKKALLIQPQAPAFIQSLTSEGIGVAKVEGKTIFIEGALPQESVNYRVFKQRRHYDEGTAVEILTPSSERSIPACAHFGTCGGCSLQHLEVQAQTAWKEKILLEQLQHLGGVSPEALLPALSAAPFGYRHKARLGARYMPREDKVFVGFRRKFGHQIADLDYCHVLHPSVGSVLAALSALFSELQAKKEIPQIEVAVGDKDSALIIRHLSALTTEDLQKIRDFAAAHHLQIYLQPNSPEPISLLWPENQPQRLSYALPDFQIEMLFHPTDFTQIHLEMNRLMVAQALTLLDLKSDEQVLDLFCGIGNFSLPMARFAKQVTGIEGSQMMTERGYENAAHNHISNVAFYAANLFLPQKEERWLQQTYEKILLDPPRTGAKEILAYFPALAPQRIVYVSCNPATLARDAGLLVKNYGYKLKQAGIMNMFPHTNHVEAMAVFEPA